MIYVALLRGINVGGNNKVEMARLKQTFERLGMEQVKTYINSGNVIFISKLSDKNKLAALLEFGIVEDFGLNVPVVIRSKSDIEALLKKLPDDFVNDEKMKCDILFLWDEVDNADAINQVKIKPDIEQLIRVPGAIIWCIGRQNINRGSILKIVGTDFYKKVTIRNPNTVRKIFTLMNQDS